MERLKPGDIVTWADTPEGQNCRERYAPGPYIVKNYYNSKAITLMHLDGSDVRYRESTSKSKEFTDFHCGILENKLRLDVFLDAARKANESNG